jgi:hypothetical protein
MKLSPPLVYFCAGTLLFGELGLHPFDQPHLHSDVEADSVDSTVILSTTASPSALLALSSYTIQK